MCEEMPKDTSFKWKQFMKVCRNCINLVKNQERRTKTKSRIDREQDINYTEELVVVPGWDRPPFGPGERVSITGELFFGQ